MPLVKLDVPKKLAAALTEHFGECSPTAILAACDYAARRKQALRKDSKRHRAGKLPAHLYAPRLDNVEKAPRKLAALASQLREVADRVKP